MGAFAGFTKKNLRPNGCSTTNFTAGVNCANSKTDKIIEIQIILMQFQFVLYRTNYGNLALKWDGGQQEGDSFIFALSVIPKKDDLPYFHQQKVSIKEKYTSI